MVKYENAIKENNMRCFICNRVLSEPNYNKDHEAYDPCDTCMVIIHDTIAGYRDKTSVDEDEFGVDYETDRAAGPFAAFDEPLFDE